MMKTAETAEQSYRNQKIEDTIKRVLEGKDLDDVQRWAGEEITDASSALYALSSVAYLLEKEKQEDHPEAAAQISNLVAAVTNLRKFIASEIMENDLGVAADAVVIEMAAGADDDTQRTQEGEGEAPATEDGEQDVERIGATLSKKNVERVQAMHDHAADMGAVCRSATACRVATEGQKVMITGAGDDVQRLSALITEAGFACEVGEAAQADPSEEVFRVDNLDMDIPGIEGAKEVIGTFLRRIIELESQPEPVRGNLSGIAINKEEDGANGVTRTEADEIHEPENPLDAIKRMHQTGGTRIERF